MERSKVNVIQKTVVSVMLFLVSVPLFAMSGVVVPFEVLRVVSADAPEKGSINWKVRSTYFAQNFRPTHGDGFTEHRAMVSIGVGYMLADGFGTGISFEFLRSAIDTASTWTSTADLEVKVNLFETSSWKTGFGFLCSIPVHATENEAGVTSLAPKLFLTLDPEDGESLSPYRIHVNIGYSATTDGDRKNDLLLAGVGVELVARDLIPFMEFTTEQAINNSSLSLRENPMRVTPGLKWRVLQNLGLSFGLDLSISTPQAAGLKIMEDWQLVIGLSKF